MNPGVFPRRVIGALHCATLLCACWPAYASERSDELKRCLGELDGIAWQLPYQPPMHIRSCATAGTTYDSATRMAAGTGLLELTGELTLGPRPSTQDGDHDYASVQDTAFAHFDALFRRHGYRRGELGYGDARSRPDPDTQRMLAGLPSREEAPDDRARRLAALTPIAYVNVAHYERMAGSARVKLTYKQEMRNTWSIRIEGMPPPGSPR
jgi:hypothetical protein